MEEMVQCPYNSAHNMPRARLQRHLIKCRVSFPNVELRTCPFNKTHMITEHCYVDHVRNCGDRTIVLSAQGPAPELVEQTQPLSTKDDDGNWDDLDTPDYSAESYAKGARILRYPAEFIPSARRAFLQNEIKRHDELRIKSNLKLLESEGPTAILEPPSPPRISNWPESSRNSLDAMDEQGNLRNEDRREGSHSSRSKRHRPYHVKKDKF